jgi:hypothetical protein
VVTRQPVGDVVVLLPGIMGSVLRKDGRDVWSTSRGALFGSLLRGTGPLEALELVDDRPECDDTGDGVSVGGLVPDTHMIPGLWSIDGYSQLGRAIRALPGVEPGANYFELAYDWRRDNRVAARKLERESAGWLGRWRESAPERAEARLVLIAHSMGGLVSRYFLEVLGGWERTRRLITLGTPFQGSLNALDFVLNGWRKEIGPITFADLTSVVRSLTSVYQLMPDFRCWDPGGGGDLLTLEDAPDLPDDLDRDRLKAARAFHAEIAEAMKRNRREDRYHEAGYTLAPITGISQPTLQSARLEDGRARILETRPDGRKDGDGRVLEQSASPVDPWYANQAHASLQNDASAVEQIGNLLTAPTDRLRAGAPRHRFGVHVDDAHRAGRPIHVRVLVSDRGDPLPGLRASVQDTANREYVVERMDLTPSDEGYEGELPGQTEGTYRLIVDGDEVEPVKDTFLVVS